jgi:hypothetical protein
MGSFVKRKINGQSLPSSNNARLAKFFANVLQTMSALVNATKMTSGKHAGYYQAQSLCSPTDPQECRPAAGSGADVYSMYRISKSDAGGNFTEGTGLPDVDPNFVYLPIINEETKTAPRNYVHAMLTGDLNSTPSESWCPAYIDPCVPGRECAVCPKTTTATTVTSQATPLPSVPTAMQTPTPATTIPPNTVHPSLWQSVFDIQVLGVNVWLMVMLVIIGLFGFAIFSKKRIR